CTAALDDRTVHKRARCEPREGLARRAGQHDLVGPVLEIGDRIDVPGAERGEAEPVDAGTAGERVSAGAAVERVVAVLADQVVAAAAPAEDVVAVIAVDGVGELVAGQVDRRGAWRAV